MEATQAKASVYRVVSTGSRKNGRVTAEIIVRYDVNGRAPFYRTYHTVVVNDGYRYEKRDGDGGVIIFS